MSFDLSALTRDYGDIYGEARACRTGAALFDFSFMSRARICGPMALAVVQSLTPRRLDDLPVGRLRYCLRLSPDGHVAVDITIWRVSADVYEVMSGRHQDVADLVAAAPPGSTEDLSTECVIYAVQGPDSLKALSQYGDGAALSQLCYFGCAEIAIAGVPCLVGRLGYTGEAGFEIIAPRESGAALWQALSAQARPAGFAAADILRIEAGFILFANELSIPVKPFELGLEPFAGTSLDCDEDPIALVAFTAETAHKPVLWQPPAFVSRPEPGEIAITSACWSPLANATLGLGYALRRDGEREAPLRDRHGWFNNIRLVKRPFFDPEKRRPRASWG